MAMTQSARLERETEQTRAHLEQTLDELRGRLSPGQIVDQAADYLRNGSGRAFAGNLRDQVVDNPLPVSLIGAGVVWLAVAGTLGRRSNGSGMHGGSGMHPVRETAEDWGNASRGGLSEAADGTAGHDAPPRTRDLGDRAASAVTGAGETLQEGLKEVREDASAIYDRTVGGTRRLASKAADYGRAARHAFEPDGTLLRLCREQPMLVAGLGIALGAAMGAMLPPSRPERRIMGEASQNMKERVRGAAEQGLRSGAEAATQSINEPPTEDGTEVADARRPESAQAEGNLAGDGAAPFAEREPASRVAESDAQRSAPPAGS
jgi:hypothetical protein